MLVYFIIISIPVIFYILQRAYSSSAKALMKICFALLIIISSFRSEYIGADYHRYVTYFSMIANTGNAYFEEKGFVEFIYILSRVLNKCYFFLLLLIY